MFNIAKKAKQSLRQKNMADSKISELTALSTPADDDIFAIVDTDAGQKKDNSS